MAFSLSGRFKVKTLVDASSRESRTVSSLIWKFPLDIQNKTVSGGEPNTVSLRIGRAPDNANLGGGIQLNSLQLFKNAKKRIDLIVLIGERHCQASELKPRTFSTFIRPIQEQRLATDADRAVEAGDSIEDFSKTEFVYESVRVVLRENLNDGAAEQLIAEACIVIPKDIDECGMRQCCRADLNRIDISMRRQPRFTA